MARPKKIVDASVLVKCFMHEIGSDDALTLWEEHASGKSLLIIPELALMEILNVLKYKGKDHATLQAANKIMWDAEFHVERTSKFLLDRAVSLALKNKLSVYDATYLALAEMFGAPLYTADEALARCPNTIKIPNKSHN